MVGTQEELVGSGLVLRRPGRVTAHTVIALLAAASVWLLTIVVTFRGTARGRQGWLALALALGLLAIWLTVLTLRAASSKIVLSETRVAVVSLAGRRSVPWSDVVAVNSDRPYLGLLGRMPVLKLANGRALAVDALALRIVDRGTHPDCARIATYSQNPGLPSVPRPTYAAQPAGRSSGGSLVVRVGGIADLPNDVAAAGRVVLIRLGLPVLWALTALSTLLLVVRAEFDQWLSAWDAAGCAFSFALLTAIVSIGFARPSVLTASAYRNGSLLDGMALRWPVQALRVDESVNLWGTRFVGHLVVIPTRGAAEVHLWETCRVSAEAYALARVALSY
jgi:hypothetical protein